ncbi:AAA family ATPase [Pseudomonas sp. LRF_L74]|uniref:AAA family ATPase n=1 Tax=Pseudomonas sp. LRF_L74 TaxID=3369422 RepID=UPI003F637C3C
MRITNIDIKHFQGLQNAALVVSAPLLLVAGPNGAGKSSLLDAVSMAMTGLPRRVSLKKDMGQLVTEGQKKGEAHVTWRDAAGEEQVSWVMLPKGNTAPLYDSPYLPFVLDASKFASLESKDRRRLLFDLAGAKASPNEFGTRLEAKGADPALVEKIKPMLKAGPQAAADQAKEYAREARGAWKALTGENYGSDKAEGWEPEAIEVGSITQADIDVVAKQVSELDQDLAEAQQTLGGHKAKAQAAGQRQGQLLNLREIADLIDRRRLKLEADKVRRDEWDGKLAEARRAAEGDTAHDPLACPHCQGRVLVKAGTLVAYVAPEKVADPEAAKRVTEYAGYLESALRAIEASQRDVKASEDAITQLAVLEQEAAGTPDANAIANAEQVINDLRQDRDKLQAKRNALQEAFGAAAGRTKLVADAAKLHEEVQAWTVIADALGQNGIPAEILSGALGPINKLLASHSAITGWSQVQISTSIEVTFGDRLYGLLSESEKWRCDTLLTIAIAMLSGLKFVAIDRFDVLDMSARPQGLNLLRQLTADGSLESAILAGSLKQPMLNPPAGMQAIWIESGAIAQPEAKAAA